jgi:hypothetical protein
MPFGIRLQLFAGYVYRLESRSDLILKIIPF